MAPFWSRARFLLQHHTGRQHRSQQRVAACGGSISGGVIVQMYGGGICQGSSTLYIAALKAGMEIVERYNHSMPSSYCPIGLDATVDYGNLDFRFSNPLETPVYISAWMDGTTLYVEFFSCFPEEWDSVAVTL